MNFAAWLLEPAGGAQGWPISVVVGASNVLIAVAHLQLSRKLHEIGSWHIDEGGAGLKEDTSSL